MNLKNIPKKCRFGDLVLDGEYGKEDGLLKL